MELLYYHKYRGTYRDMYFLLFPVLIISKVIGSKNGAATLKVKFIPPWLAPRQNTVAVKFQALTSYPSRWVLLKTHIRTAPLESNKSCEDAETKELLRTWRECKMV